MISRGMFQGSLPVAQGSEDAQVGSWDSQRVWLESGRQEILHSNALKNQRTCITKLATIYQRWFRSTTYWYSPRAPNVRLLWLAPQIKKLYGWCRDSWPWNLWHCRRCGSTWTNVGISTCIISATKRGEPRTSWNHLKPVPSQHSAHPESLGLCRTEPGSRLWNHYRPISTTWLMSTLKRVTGEFMWGSSHSWESLPQGRENAPWRWPREIPQKWRPRKKYSYTMLYNAIQYHCTPSIIRVSNAARVPQDWIRNPPEIQYIKPYKTWAKHLDYSWTHSDLSKNGEQSQEPSRTYISLDWLVLCSV